MTALIPSRIKWPVLGMVAVILAVVAVRQLQSGGAQDTAHGIVSDISESESAERLRVASIRAAEMQQGLLMHRAEDPDSRFPESDRIGSYEDLKSLLQRYWRWPKEQDLDFVSYRSASPSMFKLVLKARDRDHTELVITESDVLANGQPVKVQRRH